MQGFMDCYKVSTLLTITQIKKQNSVAMSEALPVLCGNHNYLPSPESNHHTDFYRNRFLLFFVLLSAKWHPWTL